MLVPKPFKKNHLSEKPSKVEDVLFPPADSMNGKRKATGAKQPFYFYLKEKEVFGFAGLWETWLDKQTGELLETCTIITTEANGVLRTVHDRMPVIIKAKDYEQWLDTKETKTDKLQKLLMPYPAEEMTSHAVSRSVNIPETDSPELIKPLNSL